MAAEIVLVEADARLPLVGQGAAEGDAEQPVLDALARVGVEFAFEPGRLRATATAKTVAPTGVEMEALAAVSVALLTVYDMCKAVDRAMEIGGVLLVSKTKSPTPPA